MKTSESTPNIRAATGEDAPELARLMSLFNNESISPTQAAERLKKLDGIETALLAHKDGQLVGIACLRVAQVLFGNAPHAEVIEFYIEQSQRDGDIEHQLLRKLEALASQGGAAQITLLTGLKNAETQALYRSAGYQDYALSMRKLLTR
jgi:ribosomal protein S18 acetylase RimI-like enzyme